MKTLHSCAIVHYAADVIGQVVVVISGSRFQSKLVEPVFL